jgi:hypothetical protein
MVEPLTRSLSGRTWDAINTDDIILPVGFDTLNFSTCQWRRSAIIRHIKINGLSEPYNGRMVSSSQLLN